MFLTHLPKHAYFSLLIPAWRRYQEDWLECAVNKMDSKSRETYLQPKTAFKPKPHFVYCTTFIPKTKNIKDIILKHWHILQNDPSLKDTIKEPPMVTFKRGRNIRDTVSPPALRSPEHQAFN